MGFTSCIRFIFPCTFNQIFSRRYFNILQGSHVYVFCTQGDRLRSCNFDIFPFRAHVDNIPTIIFYGDPPATGNLIVKFDPVIASGHNCLDVIALTAALILRVLAVIHAPDHYRMRQRLTVEEVDKHRVPFFPE